MQTYLRNKFLTNVFLLCFTISGFKCASNRQFERLISKRDVEFPGLTSDYSTFLDLVKPIAVKRVSGTPEIVAVRNYITTKMKSYGWDIGFDSFNDKTPYGVKEFTNIIATYPIGRNNLNLEQVIDKTSHYAQNNRIVFACHYDSKYFKNFDFVAATDSAVPCAMLLDFAKFLSENFDKSYFKRLNRHLEFLFFDGEEAFVDWSPTDSIYGSRHYANLLKAKYRQNAALDSIDLFVLFDLIGADNSAFPNYFPQDTQNAYKVLSQIENILIQKKMLHRRSPYYFTDLQGYGRYSQVQDDHLPFLSEGVPILHLIPSPFPSQWHNSRDTVSNLNQNNIQDLRMIFKYFLLSITNPKSEEKKSPKDIDDEF